MKKISFTLAVLLIVTSFAALFTVGVSAADYQNGDVVFAHSGAASMKAYYYADDATAAAGGAIARFPYTVGGESMNVYLKDWASVGGFGATYASVITLVGKDGKISFPTGVSADTGGRSFTIDGNGVTIEGAGRIDLNGREKVTVKNLNISNTSTGGNSAMQMGGGITVTFDNVKIENVNPTNYGTVILQKNSSLIMTNGSSVKNTKALANSYEEVGVRLNQQNATLTLDETCSIESMGHAVYLVEEGTKVTVDGALIRSSEKSAIIGCGTAVVNGGVLESLNERTIYIGNQAFDRDGDTVRETVVHGVGFINGGEIIVGGGYAALHAYGEAVINVNGGLIRTSKNDVTLGIGLCIVGGGSTNGGKIVVNGGTFYYPGATKSSPILKAHESADNSHLIEIKGGDFLGTKFIFGGNYVASGEPTDSITLDAPVMYNGASIRTAAESNGIRFRSTISSEALIAAEAAKKAGTAVRYGTLIALAESIEKTGGIFTAEALKGAGEKYVDIPAVNGVVTNADGSVSISAALVNIKESNKDKAFSAVAYISIETESGTVTVYSAYSATNNSRTLEGIAYAALSDVKTSSEGHHTTAVSEWYALENGAYVKKTGSAYSPYSEAQLAVIKTYLATADAN